MKNKIKHFFLHIHQNPPFNEIKGSFLQRNFTKIHYKYVDWKQIIIMYLYWVIYISGTFETYYKSVYVTNI